MKKSLIIFLSLIFLTSCARKIDVLNYRRVFSVSLGTNQEDVGSNLPILDAFTNRRGLPSSMLLDIPAPVIEGGKVYFADTYNKRVQIYGLDGKHQLTIPNVGAQYEFARPYLVYVDKTESIYVAASEKDNESFEVQFYTNQNISERDYFAFQSEQNSITSYNYYIYKFSSRGEFLGRFGFTDTDPMPFPAKIQGDALGNIYVQFDEQASNDSPSRIFLRRYSRTGELSFEFRTRSIRLETNINNINYQGHITSVDNLINDEQLLVMVEFQPLTNNKGENVPIEVDNIFSSLYVYSILENNFTRTIASFKGITPGVLGTDARGHIFYENYDSESDTLRIIRAPIESTNDGATNYVPLQSSYYTLNPYFIDSSGNLYNTVIDRNTSNYILEW
ncbi:MAG: hypothetical protein ACRCY4_08795, partial [Brevinema sp.]